MKTIAIFGDSVAAGVYHKQVKHELDRFLKIELDARGYAEYVIQNFGIRGATTAVGLMYVEETAMARPDLTIVNIGVNDAVKVRDNLAEYMDNLTKIVQTLKKSGTQLILLGPSYVDGKVRKTANQATIESYDHGAKQVAKLEAVPFVDVYQEMGMLQEKERFLQADGLHPSLFGYHLLAMLIADMIDKKQLL